MMHTSKSGSAYFECGSAVEIKMHNYNGSSWVAGTIIHCFPPRRFLVAIADEQSQKPMRKFVSLQRLRPLLPRKIYRPKLKFGNNRDYISELPDLVLLHIMSFMDAKDAIRTCVLSKRWKNVCKSLTSLTFSCVHQCKDDLTSWKKFASWVLTSRDSSYSLFNLTMDNWIGTEVDLFNTLMQYAVCHNLQHFTMLQNSMSKEPLEIVTLSSISYCQTLTSLKLCCFDSHSTMMRLPKSLHLPALKSLHLQNLYFTADDNGYIEPFSNCHVLSTLFIRYHCWYNEGDVLCISNLTLSRLTLEKQEFSSYEGIQIVLCTPCLSSININGVYDLQLSSIHNLSFIEEVNIDMYGMSAPTIMSCLQVFVNVKILTLSSRTLETILYDYPQPPHFVRLELLKLDNAKKKIRDRAIKKGVKYLLQNSLMAKSIRQLKDGDIFYFTRQEFSHSV